MPSAPAKPCRHPLCPHLAPAGGRWCTLHAPAQILRGTEERSRFDRRRGSASSRGYDAQWSRLAQLFRAQHPIAYGYLVPGPNYSYELATDFAALREMHEPDVKAFIAAREAWLWQTRCYVLHHGNEISPAEAVDHIVPHRGDETLRLAEWNLQPISHAWHSEKTARHDGGFRGARLRAGDSS